MAEFEDENGNDDAGSRWLTTYADAVTLLLVFLVLLLSMSTINPETFRIIITSFQGAVGVFEAGRTLSPRELLDMGINVHELSEVETTVQQNIPREIKKKLRRNFKAATIRQDERGLVIQLTDRILFEPDQTQVREEGREYLRNVREFLTSPGVLQRQVRVEGHTDNREPAEYSSNWELSVLRAVNVVEFLSQAPGPRRIRPDRLSAVGFGATRPIASNNTAEGRAKNRRVEIVILRPDIENDRP